MKLAKEQKRFCDRIGADYVPVHSTQMIGVSQSFLTGAWPVHALRHQPTGNGCGWFAWAGEDLSDSEDFFQPVHVQHVIESRRSFAKYLGLPPGHRVLYDDFHEDVWFDRALLISSDG